jgi:uncharacterized protein (TIGR04255 family)
MNVARGAADEDSRADRMQSATDDLFPVSAREIYRRAPLIQVLCQLQFPPLLKIEAETPADFQERVRHLFPEFQRGAPQLVPPLPQMQLLPQIMQLLGMAGGTSYRFLSEDGASVVTLAPNLLSVATTAYTRWENFRDQLRAPVAALIEIYRPAYFSLVGLRYINAIQRGILDLQGRSWSELINRAILGELALSQFEQNLESAQFQARVKIPNGNGSFILRSGVAQVVQQVQTVPELSFMLDFESLKDQRTEVQDAERLLTGFHELAGRAFRWCITDFLRDALGPRPVETGDDRNPSELARPPAQ